MRNQNQASAATPLSCSLPATLQRRKCVSAFAAMAGKWVGFLALCLFISGISAVGQTPPTRPPSAPPPPDDPGDLGPGYPRLDQPWGKGETQKKKTRTAPKPTPVRPQTPVASTPPPAPVPAATPAPSTSAVEAPPPDTAAPPPALRIPQNEVSVSGDFLLGQGNVTLPFGFSLQESGVNVQTNVAKPDRSSTYFGGTISYSYGQKWYLDLAYAKGNSSGDTLAKLGGNEDLPSHFSIDDTWYQVYVRYTFPALRGKHLSAYLRAGFSYVTAELTDTTVIPALGLYHQKDKTEDLLGNIGFGIAYYLVPSRHTRIYFQIEGEGFYGRRSQKSLEFVEFAAEEGTTFVTANIDNDLYGGVGQGTVRFEYRSEEHTSELQ